MHVFLYYYIHWSVKSSRFFSSQMELATGEFPYAKWDSPFQQIKQVVMEDSPKLPSDQFSPEFCDFIAKWYCIVLFYWYNFSYWHKLCLISLSLFFCGDIRDQRTKLHKKCTSPLWSSEFVVRRYTVLCIHALHTMGLCHQAILSTIWSFFMLKYSSSYIFYQHRGQRRNIF